MFLFSGAPAEQGMSVVVVIDDLVFQAKIRAAAHQLGVPLDMMSDAARLPEAVKTASLVIVDLGLTAHDPVDAIRVIRAHAPTVPILAYGSHVETELFARATRAGCTQVMPRSVFVQQLPHLLKDTTSAQ